MADKERNISNKTTSSKTLLDGTNDDVDNRIQQQEKQTQQHIAASTTLPKSGEAQMLNKLAHNLSESYQLVKQRQQKYNKLSAKSVPNDGTIKKALAQQEQQVPSRMNGSCVTQQNSNNKNNNNNTGAITSNGDSSNGGDNGNNAADGGGSDWQEVISATNNKLKRKKKLSASLTSVTDSVNQEKRTRIEGIQLNCRGKLQITETNCCTGIPATNTNTCPTQMAKAEKFVSKPPLPPLAAKNSTTTTTTTTTITALTQQVKVPPPPRLKRKLQENVQTIQKLNALTEQLRLEINELKSNLTTERGAVRVLRAQNESETRKWKNEVKKLQNSMEHLKKNSVIQNRKTTEGSQASVENLSHPITSASGLVNYEIQRLTNEIIALKEANKNLEEKKMINCDAERRKAADMRALKDSYEIRLTQLTKSAKTEISRLLEEIKTKERNIGQLKRDLQILQNKPQSQVSDKSRNATITQQLQTTKTSKTIDNKPKKLQQNGKQQKQQNEIALSTSCSHKKEDTKDKNATNQVQTPNEMKKLKDIELINNTKNLQNNIHIKSTKILTNSQNTNSHNNNHNHNNNNNNSNNNNNNSNKFKSLEINQQQQQQQQQQQHEEKQKIMLNDENCNNNNLLKATTTTALTITTCGQQQKEYHSLPHELTERLLSTTTASEDGMERSRNATTTDTATNTEEETHQHEYRNKDNNSDSDSALSSAPPSISPQPPPAGMDAVDIWQSIRTYTTDIERLQKDIELLHKENEHLRHELHLAKEQILDTEKIAIQTNNNSSKQAQLMERIKFLEEQEHQLQADANELREQNELLEFRILELEETNDKWSLQSHPTHVTTVNTATTSAAHTDPAANAKDVWGCVKPNKDDPMQMLFGSHNSTINMDSGIMSPQDQQQINDEFSLPDTSNEELRRRIAYMLKKSSLDDEDRQCLQQVVTLVQQMDILSQRSGSDSLNTTSSCDEPSSLEIVKSRISDYGSASSPSSSARSASTATATKSLAQNTNSRIVATVQPYNTTTSNSSPHQHYYQQQQLAPTNTPTDSPRKQRHTWQSNSLSESGVFVESDFLSDISEQTNVCTQTDFDEDGDEDAINASVIANTAKELSGELERLQYGTLRTGNNRSRKVPATHLPLTTAVSLNLNEQKRIQYYKERLEVLESKILIYESSGDLQAKRLADRLQREIQLEKELKELRDRVEFLESENATLEEEKCEFEEAENDTRLRLQRLEIELEILSQRNVELEMSREALSAKYKDCRSECLILKDDLAVSETQIRHLEEDKQKAKENLEFLHSALPLFVIYNTLVAVPCVVQPKVPIKSRLSLPLSAIAEENTCNMGNTFPDGNPCERSASLAQFEHDEAFFGNCTTPAEDDCDCQVRELLQLREEVKCLRHQIKQLNARHYEAMESADSHWVDLEREYKEREEGYRAKEHCLKQKINKLQDCLRDDARAANEKILQLEEAEKELKCCLLRVSKEHRDIVEEHQSVIVENERFKEQYEELKLQQKPLTDALEQEKRRNKALLDEINYMRKAQQETELKNLNEMEASRTELFNLKKEFLQIEVTNGELKEEVATLEQQIETLQNNEKECVDKIRCLTDEVRSKEEMCQKLEKRLERSEGYSLAHELNGSPSKRFKREDVTDLRSATVGLSKALRNVKDCEDVLPSHQQFQSVARDVKRLADTILGGSDTLSTDEVSNTEEVVEDKKTENVEEQVVKQEDNVEDVIVKMENDVEKEAEEAKEDVVEEAAEEVKPELEITVGMAFVPEFKIDESLLPSCSTESKKQICEVPSELRKLSLVPIEAKAEESITPSLPVPIVLDGEVIKKQIKRKLRKRISRPRHSTLNARVRRIVSCLISRHSPTAVKGNLCQFSDLDICQSEILQRNVSYDSFHSVKEDNVEISAKVDAYTETITERIDKETETVVEKTESSVQVNDDMNPEHVLKHIPSSTRAFFHMLMASVTQTNLERHRLNSSFLKRWEADHEFRDGLEILQTFITNDPDDNDSELTQPVTIENYEHFVNAMSCLHVLEELFKPLKISILQQIEDEINEQLMNFHRKRMESEFYCTVYYPVKRELPIDLNDVLIK